MLNETVNAILEAEKNASQMIQGANDDAKEMVVNADAECEKIRNIAKTSIKEERAKVVASAVAEGDEQYANILVVGKKQADKLKRDTDCNKAVEFIKEKVLAGYVNS